MVRIALTGFASAISGPDITIAGTTVTGVPRAITELLRNSASVVEVTAEWVEERWALVPGEVVRINTLPGGFIASGTTVSERATSAAPTTPAAAAQRTPRPAAHASAGLAGVTRARPAFAGLAAAHAATDPRASSRSGPQVSGRHRVAQSFPDCDF
jgi:transposase